MRLVRGAGTPPAAGTVCSTRPEVVANTIVGFLTEFQALDRVSGIGYRRDGYLFLLDREEDVESFRQAVAMQQALGVPSQLVSPDDVKEMNPALETGDLLAAAYCPIDGHASPESVVQAYAGAAGAQGVRILQGTTLQRIAVLGDKIVSVETSAGRIRTGTVVCAAGVWSRSTTATRQINPNCVWRRDGLTACISSWLPTPTSRPRRVQWPQRLRSRPPGCAARG